MSSEEKYKYLLVGDGWVLYGLASLTFNQATERNAWCRLHKLPCKWRLKSQVDHEVSVTGTPLRRAR